MRRWAVRIAAGIGIVLLVLFWVLAGAAYITARPADPQRCGRRVRMRGGSRLSSSATAITPASRFPVPR